MKENIKYEQIGLIGELMQGKELAKQLCEQFFSPSSSSSSSSSSLSSPSSSSTSSNVENEILVDKIILSIEKALTMLKGNVGQIKTKKVTMMDCNFSNERPKSEFQDSEFKHVSKKRKTMTKWTEKVKVCLGSTSEGSMEDGYSWRKYGQKDIHGSKFPRGYYRCTHRNVQGCLATKQVQKSDEDSMIHEITYKGRHTCTQSSNFNKPLSSKKRVEFRQNNKSHTNKKIQPQEEKIQPPQDLYLSLDNKEDIFPSFNFSSQSIESKNEGDNMFLETMIENNFMENEDNNIFSESNIFCMSLLDLDNIGPGPSESDSTKIISDPNSVANSPIDFDVFNDINFDVDFLINTQEFCY